MSPIVIDESKSGNSRRAQSRLNGYAGCAGNNACRGKQPDLVSAAHGFSCGVWFAFPLASDSVSRCHLANSCRDFTGLFELRSRVVFCSKERATDPSWKGLSGARRRRSRGLVLMTSCLSV